MFRVGGVVRNVRFQKGQERPATAIIAGLREKYGPESFAGPARGAYVWLFDEQGRRATGITTQSNAWNECAAFFSLPNLSEQLEPGGTATNYLGNIVSGLQSTQKPCKLVSVIAFLEQSMSNAALVHSVTVSVRIPPGPGDGPGDKSDPCRCGRGR
jgi:hypothetical protein